LCEAVKRRGWMVGDTLYVIACQFRLSLSPSLV
jgi:hypothetical protein